MDPSRVKLPSNRSFGFFFTFIFAAAALYFYYSTNVSMVFTYIFSATASIFLFVTLIKSDVLLPLNTLWMRLGLLLGMIITPVVLGVIFFGLFTPIAIFMRLRGRDELRLKDVRRVSHWIWRTEPIKSESFKYQF